MCGNVISGGDQSPFYFDLLIYFCTCFTLKEIQYRHSDGIPSYRLNGGLTKFALESLVEYAYTGQLEAPDVMVKEVYLAAWMLRIDNVVNECARHLVAEMSADSSIEIRSLPGINKNRAFVMSVDSFISSQVRMILCNDLVSRLVS